MKLPVSNDPGVQELLDREAIRDVLMRYCHAIDRCDAGLLRSVYWPGATDDHVFWRGTAEAFVDFCMPILESRDQTMHNIGNILIRIDGNAARVQSYFDSYERLRGKEGRCNDITASGRYLDRMEKRDGEWRIAERKVVIDWYRIWNDSADWQRGMFGHKLELGKRREQDPSHPFFAGTI